jgi:hypothetical protein
MDLLGLGVRVRLRLFDQDERRQLRGTVAGHATLNVGQGAGDVALMSAYLVRLDDPTWLEGRAACVSVLVVLPDACEVIGAPDELPAGRWLDYIAEQLDGREWDADTSAAVAELVRSSGRAVREPFDEVAE